MKKYYDVRGVKDDGKIPQTITRRRDSFIGISCIVTAFQNNVSEGKIERRIEVTGRRGRKDKQLLDNLK
jgi:hypothetical protein